MYMYIGIKFYIFIFIYRHRRLSPDVKRQHTFDCIICLLKPSSFSYEILFRCVIFPLMCLVLSFVSVILTRIRSLYCC